MYNWVRDNSGLEAAPRQIEFARLNLSYTVMSKRKLRRLVEEGVVDGWDDPRMPTLSGLRRRGYTPASIRDFLERVGVAKTPNTVELALLEHCLREDLNHNARRAMMVLRPVRLTITNYPEGRTEAFEVENNPERPEEGTRQVTFSRHLWIEEEDFLENPPGKYFRLSPGREVRLKGAYVVRCTGCVKDESGHVIEVLTPRPGAAIRRTAAVSRVPSTGWMRKRQWTRRCGCTTPCLPSPIPRQGRAISWSWSIPLPWRS